MLHELLAHLPHERVPETVSILADIGEMEDRVAELIVGVEDAIDPASSRYERAVIEAVLDILDEFDIEDLAEVDLQRVINEALADLTPQLQAAIQEQIAGQLQEMVSVTREFYQVLEIDPPGVSEAVQRSRATSELTAFLEDGMNLVDEQLKDETLNVLLETVSAGQVNASVIEERIADRTDAAASVARTQARTSLTGYNQLYRNELASKAELEHFLYYGTLKPNSRRFCRVHAGHVYTSRQIAKMDNGMLNPVRVFKGGYNCRHSWVPVDPTWSDELRRKVVSEDRPAVSVSIDERSDRSITTIPPVGE